MYKICFADDEPIVFKVLNALVDWEGNGYQIAGTATDGIEAFSLYEKEKPDFFIIDIKMPLLDGLSCIRKIRENDKKIKIVLLTASDSFSSAQEALNLGANGYLLKPVSRDSIHKIVAKITAELDQETSMQNDTAMNTDSLLIQKDLRMLYSFGINPPQNTNWGSDNQLLKGNYGLIDIFIHRNTQQAAKETDIYVEGLLDNFEKIGIHTHAHFISVNNRVLCAVSPFNEEKILKLKKLQAEFYPDFEYAQYVLPKISSGISMQYLGDSLKLNKVHQFYHPGNLTELFYTGLQVQDSPLPVSESKNILTNALKEIDETPVIDFLHKIFSCAQTELQNYVQLQSFCFNIIMQLKMRLKEFGMLNPDIEPDKLEIDSFLNTQNADDLFVYTTENISKQFKELTAKQEFAGNKSIVLKANAYAAANYHYPLFSLESAANHVGLSKNYFIFLYKKETGLSFWNYVTQLRIEQAKLLLRSTQLSMFEICTQVGYTDVSYFSGKFKSKVGMSPRRYRENETSSRA